MIREDIVGPLSTRSLDGGANGEADGTTPAPAPGQATTSSPTSDESNTVATLNPTAAAQDSLDGSFNHDPSDGANEGEDQDDKDGEDAVEGASDGEDADEGAIDGDEGDDSGNDESDTASQDDKQVKEIHLPVGKKVLFKFRSQDVLHSAYMPHFRAQMNCVPGMVTQFAFTPKYTTEQMRQNSEVIAKSEGINKIRSAKGEELYEFDYLLLCNKICGASHYSMQMKIVVETEDEFKQWLAKQPTLAESIKK